MKIKRLLFAVIISILILSGCAKCISTKSEFVDVTVVDEYYRSMYQTPIFSGGEFVGFMTYPAEYRITVEYDGVRYGIGGESAYRRYSNRIGDTVTGILETKTYDDGSVTHDIIELE